MKIHAFVPSGMIQPSIIDDMDYEPCGRCSRPREHENHAGPVATVEFVEAKLGEEAFTYSEIPGPTAGEYAFVTELEWFDDRYDELRLTRRRWRLIAQDEIVLPNRFSSVEEDE